MAQPGSDEWQGGELIGCAASRQPSAAERAFPACARCMKIDQRRRRPGEQARNIALSTYTESYWKIDLHNLLHFLALRMDSHAQYEIRSYATAIGEQILQPLFPLVWEAFVDYRLEAMSLSRLERDLIARLTQRMREIGRAAASDDDFLAVQDPTWRDLTRCRERDECREKLIRL
jgi:thymidylate synthase (FAD)